MYRVGFMERITSRRNPLATHIKRLGADRVYRVQCGEFLCDGEKLLKDAVKGNADITTILTAVNISVALPPDVRVFSAPRDLIDSLSPLKNSQGILFICKIPITRGFVYEGGTYVLLDDIQDPGNVGSIIRTANAFGINAVLMTEQCADIYNPKTIRATMGAVFRQKVFGITPVELLELKEKGVRIIGASMDKDSCDISSVNLKNTIITIGNEGKGISEDILALCDEKVIIPIAPECESLGAAAAAAVLMYLARG